MSNVKTVMSQAAAASTVPDGAWDLSFAYYDAPFAFDVSSSVVFSSVSVSSQETSPQGVFFKPDGLKMFVIGTSSDAVNEYNLSTAFDVSTASYSTNFSVSSQTGSPRDLFFKPDGTKMFIIENTNDSIYEYDLSTGWDVTSASYQATLDVSSLDSFPSGISFKPDGTKMYVLGLGTDEVFEHDLSTAWDITSASYLQSFDFTSQENGAHAISFSPDGDKVYVIGQGSDSVFEYNLSTPWDVSTITYVQGFSVTSSETTPTGLFVKADGSGFFICGEDSDRVSQYSMGGFDVSSQEGAPRGLFFKSDGTKMYVSGAGAQAAIEYDLSAAWDVSTASHVQNFSVSAQDTSPQNLFFKSDGTKMYVVGGIGDDVNEYDLSTAWNVSTASYVQNFSVSAQETSPQGIFFKSDGTKMYIIGTSGDDINVYNLSTAWDISTATHRLFETFSVSAQETSPQGIFFKSDGTKMYIIGASGDDVNEYDLSTAWNVSTASYVQNFSVSAQETSPESLFFKPDGTQMFIVGTNSDQVYSYTLGPQD